jgi:hypothetical protein
MVLDTPRTRRTDRLTGMGPSAADTPVKDRVPVSLSGDEGQNKRQGLVEEAQSESGNELDWCFRCACRGISSEKRSCTNIVI